MNTKQSPTSLMRPCMGVNCLLVLQKYAGNLKGIILSFLIYYFKYLGIISINLTPTCLKAVRTSKMLCGARLEFLSSLQRG